MHRDRANNTAASIRQQWTAIVCPQCGKHTGIQLRDGHAHIYCRRCKWTIEVTIHAYQEHAIENHIAGPEPLSRCPVESQQ